MNTSLRQKNPNASSRSWIKYTKRQPCAPMYGRLYHYAENNPVRYIDPDGRLAKEGFGHYRRLKPSDTTWNVQLKKNTNTKYEVILLYTNKGNPIFGIKEDRNFRPDTMGKIFASGQYSLCPDWLSDDMCKYISELTGVELSTKSEILSVIINDECQSVSKENVEVGDYIFTSFMREGEEHIQFVGQVTRVKQVYLVKPISLSIMVRK